MYKQEYLRQLRKELKGFDEEEVKKALAYCEEYFDEAQDEQQVMQDLGSPSQFVAQLKKDTGIDVDEQKKTYSIWSNILLGVCCIPIIGVGVIVAFSLLLVFGCIILSLVLSMISAVVIGFGSLFYISSFDGSMLLFLGIGVACIGFSLLWICALYFMVKLCKDWGKRGILYMHKKIKERRVV